MGQSSEGSQHLGLSSRSNNNYPSKPHLRIKIPSYSSETKLPLWSHQARFMTEIQPTSPSRLHRARFLKMHKARLLNMIMLCCCRHGSRQARPNRLNRGLRPRFNRRRPAKTEIGQWGANTITEFTPDKPPGFFRKLSDNTAVFINKWVRSFSADWSAIPRSFSANSCSNRQRCRECSPEGAAEYD